jgi:hypothetical protein
MGYACSAHNFFRAVGDFTMAETKKKTAKKAPAKKKAAPKKAAPKAKAKAAPKKAAPKFTLSVDMTGKQRTLSFSSAELRDIAFDKLQLRSKYMGNVNMLKPIEVETVDGVVTIHRVSSVVK